jgi:hypothetical protein
MTALDIRYRFELPDGTQKSLHLQFDPADFRLRSPSPEPRPFWTELNFKQCTNCPLKAAEQTHCPAALHMAPAVQSLAALVSYDKLNVTVQQSGRTITAEVSAQRALSSVLGLIMATSGCPWTDRLRPMARFHLPFATEAETLYRSVSMYLMARELKVVSDGGYEALHTLYENLHVVNRDMSRRLGAATKTDPARNAMALLDVYAMLLPIALEGSLADFAPLFDAWRKPAGQAI